MTDVTHNYDVLIVDCQAPNPAQWTRRADEVPLEGIRTTRELIAAA
jgi:hypothetical protein